MCWSLIFNSFALSCAVDDLLEASSNLAAPSPSTRRSARSTFGAAINPYSTGLNYHQKQPLQPNFVSWWYPHLYKRISSSFLVQDDERQNNTSHRATYFPESKQSVIAYGFGPSLQIQKTTPFDSLPDRIFGGVDAINGWNFMVRFLFIIRTRIRRVIFYKILRGIFLFFINTNRLSPVAIKSVRRSPQVLVVLWRSTNRTR